MFRAVQPYGRNLRTTRESGFDSTLVPRALRINLFDRLIIMWRLPARWPMILPVPDTLNRFLAPDFVFILGIQLSISDFGSAKTEPR